MDPDKINTIAIRVLGITLAAFLLIGGAGACVNHFYLKGIIGILAAPAIGYMAFQPASLKTWGIIIAVFVVAMLANGQFGN